jgi:hypothetical protein
MNTGPVVTDRSDYCSYTHRLVVIDGVRSNHHWQRAFRVLFNLETVARPGAEWDIPPIDGAMRPFLRCRELAVTRQGTTTHAEARSTPSLAKEIKG